MPSEAYLAPEPPRGRSVIQAYGGYLEDHDLEVEVGRIFADLGAALKKDVEMDEAEIRAIFDDAMRRVFDGS